MQKIAALIGAALALVGLSGRKQLAPPRGGTFRSRRVEFKDDASGGIAAKIAGEIATLAARVALLESSAKEFKSLPAEFQNLPADLGGLKIALEEMRKTHPELKGMSDSSAQRMDALEKRLNELNVNGKGKEAGQVKGYAEIKSLDVAMRSHQNVDIKSLDSDLKVQSIIHDDVIITDCPLLEMASFKPVGGDAPNWSFPTGATVTHKGAGAGAANARKKVKGDVIDYEYQPTLEKGDVDDTGSFLLDDEAANFIEGTRETLHTELIDEIETKALAANGQGFDQYVNPVISVTGAHSGFTAADLDTLVGSLAKRYRKGAVFVAASDMVTTLMAITDATTHVSLWQPSLAQGVPATLKGYPFLEDAAVSANRIIFGNPRRGLRIGEREKPALSNIERSGGDYKPYFSARYDRGVLDARAIKVMDLHPGP